jgi:hypothetical protein
LFSRLQKELVHYQKELVENEKKCLELKALAAVNRTDENAAADVKRFGHVVDESRMMIPDTERRLKEALDELNRIVRECPLDNNDEARLEGEWYQQAKALLSGRQSDQLPTDDAPYFTTSVDNLAEGENF